MKYFLYFSDGHWEDGDIGFEVFDSQDSALNFISDRISADSSRNLINYTLIEGKQLDLEPTEIIKGVKVKP